MNFILGLVGKKWSIYRVSPLWNLNFSSIYLDQLSKQLNTFLTKSTATNSKNQKIFEICVKFEAIEAQHECIAVKVIKLLFLYYTMFNVPT